MCLINEVMTWGSIITSEKKQCYYVTWISQINKNTEMAQQQTQVYLSMEALSVLVLEHICDQQGAIN